MAIELISTITTKNNGNYAIALSNEIRGGIHSKRTITERDSISSDRLQEGMLCYVSQTEQYYQWKDEEWIVFSIGSGGNSDGGGTGTPMYRVDTYEDMLSINKLDVINGTLCHIINDIHQNYLYYYHIDKWKPVGSKYQVWIGTDTPPNKNYLWVDTRNLVSGEDVTMENPPTFIDTQIVQYLKEQIYTLNNKIKELQNIINNGNFGGNNGNNNNNNNNNNDNNGSYIELKGTYMVDENGNYLLTESGDFIITEDSFVDSISPGEEGYYEEIELKGTYIVDENGNYLLTESGGFIITEDSYVDSTSPGEQKPSSGNNNNNNNNNNNGSNEEAEIEDVPYAVKGGRIITTTDNEELLQITITQVTIYNESEDEITLIINNGEPIPIQSEESLSLGDIDIYSIIVVEKGSTIKYIGI